MTVLADFIARENIRRYKAQILDAPEGHRKSIICGLLEVEEGQLRELLTVNGEPR